MLLFNGECFQTELLDVVMRLICWLVNWLNNWLIGWLNDWLLRRSSQFCFVLCDHFSRTLSQEINTNLCDSTLLSRKESISPILKFVIDSDLTPKSGDDFFVFRIFRRNNPIRLAHFIRTTQINSRIRCIWRKKISKSLYFFKSVHHHFFHEIFMNLLYN